MRRMCERFTIRDFISISLAMRNAMATDSTHRTTRGKRTRRVSFKGKEPQHATIMFLPCHPYKVNRGGDNRDDPRRILEDFVDCVSVDW